uniref:ATP-dependent DNA helicase n=1 Tax=Steinernema glaseri TaxID=37863 RepID=A0A1I7YH27_9BILA
MIGFEKIIDIGAILNAWKSRNLSLLTTLILIPTFSWLITQNRPLRGLQTVSVFNNAETRIWIRCDTTRISFSPELLKKDAGINHAKEEGFVSIDSRRSKSCYAAEFGFTMFVSILVERKEKILKHMALNHPVNPYNDVEFTLEGRVLLGRHANGQAVGANKWRNFWYVVDCVRWHWTTRSFLRGILTRYRVHVVNQSGKALYVSCTVRQKNMAVTDYTVVPHNTSVNFEPSPMTDWESSHVYAISALSEHGTLFKNLSYDVSLTRLTIRKGDDIEEQHTESELLFWIFFMLVCGCSLYFLTKQEYYKTIIGYILSDVTICNVFQLQNFFDIKMEHTEQGQDDTAVGRERSCQQVELQRLKGLQESKSDAFWRQTLSEGAAQLVSTEHFCRFFALLLFHCRPSNPEDLFEQFLDRILPPNQSATLADRRTLAFRYIAFYLQEFTISLREIAPSWPDIILDIDEVLSLEDKIKPTVQDIGPQSTDWKRIADEEKHSLNVDQLRVYAMVMDALTKPKKHKLIRVEGVAGTGKTYLCNAIIAKLRAMKIKVEAITPAGITANGLRGGKTAHSLLRIPLDVDILPNFTPPNVKYESAHAKVLRDTKLIIIDDMDMMGRTVYEHIDKTLRACFLDTDPESKIVFAGKCVLLSGTLKRGDRFFSYNNSLFAFDLFRSFCEVKLEVTFRVDFNKASFIYLLRVFNSGFSVYGDHELIEIPEGCQMTTLEELIEFCFPKVALSDPIEQFDMLRENIILCLTNDEAREINEMVLRRVKGQERKHRTIDRYGKVINQEAFDIMTGAYDSEEDIGFNRKEENFSSNLASSLPPLELNLKVGAIVMVIVDLNRRQGLPYGTLLQVTAMCDTIITCRRLVPDSRFDDVVYITKMKFTHKSQNHGETEPFETIQFPLRLAFAITIYESQREAPNCWPFLQRNGSVDPMSFTVTCLRQEYGVCPRNRTQPQSGRSCYVPYGELVKEYNNRVISPVSS